MATCISHLVGSFLVGLNAIQFSKTNVLYDIVSMRQNNIQEDRSWTADRYLYDSSDYVTL